MDSNSVLQAVTGGEGLPALQAAQPRAGSSPRTKPQLFTAEQRQVLLKYFDECGMTSTHRRNAELIQRCATDVGTTIERVKNWIGSEAVKRKKKAGILPRPKIEITGSANSPQTRFITPPPAKKIKRVNGYNLFFSNCVRTSSDISTDFRERNATVARKWAELSEDERKDWAAKAEAVCSSSLQEAQGLTEENGEGREMRGGGGGGGESEHGKSFHPLLNAPSGGGSVVAGVLSPELSPEDAIIEKTLLSIQEKFDLLEQVGFEGYAVLVNTTELQTHFLSTSKGRSFHKLRQQQGKPLENPFIGHVFTEEPDTPGPSLVSPSTLTQGATQKRLGALMSGLNSAETMQKSVVNAFALKYKVATGRSDIPYDNLQNLGVQVYGMPPGVPFHNPLLYNQQQLQQILASLEKIVFLKLGPHVSQDSAAQLSVVEIPADSVASLVTHGHQLHLGAEEEAGQ